MSTFQDKVDRIWCSFDFELIDTCELKIYCVKNRGEKKCIGNYSMEIGDYYFQEICNEIVLIFNEEKWLSTFIFPAFDYDISKKFFKFRSREDLVYHFQF